MQTSRQNYTQLAGRLETSSFMLLGSFIEPILLGFFCMKIKKWQVFLMIRNKIIAMRSSQNRDSEILEFLEKFKLLIRNWISWCPKISILFFDHRIYLMITSLRNRGPLKVLNTVRAGFCAT